MNKPRLLDLFCGAGGAAAGYHRAGFEVVGVDIQSQKHYPFEFYQGDALTYALAHGREFDVIHASPPCQGYSVTRNLHGREYPLLISDVRAALQATGKPYVIENVEGARKHMIAPLLLCGTMFGLQVIRHRLFEMSVPVYFTSPCCHVYKTARRGEYDTGQRGYITVVGHNFNLAAASKAMGIDWMTRDELAESIPPAYTEFIGTHLMQAIGVSL